MWIQEGHRPPQAVALSLTEMVAAAEKASNERIGVLYDGDLATTSYVAEFVQGSDEFNRQRYDDERNEHLLRLDRYLVTTSLDSFYELVNLGLPGNLREDLIRKELSLDAVELFNAAKDNGLEPFIGLMPIKTTDGPRQANWGVIPFAHPGYVPEGWSDGKFSEKVRLTFADARRTGRMRMGVRAR